MSQALERDLIRKARTGDQDAFAELVEMHAAQANPCAADCAPWARAGSAKPNTRATNVPIKRRPSRRRWRRLLSCGCWERRVFGVGGRVVASAES